jgi:hypothetical protein
VVRERDAMCAHATSATAAHAAARATLGDKHVLPDSPWCLCPPHAGGSTLPATRQAQLAARTLGNVGFATAIDIGDPQSPFGSVHPRHKQVVGTRLTNAALTQVYNMALPWESPMYSTAMDTSFGNTLVAVVSFTNVDAPLVASNYECPTSLGVPADQCGSYTITDSTGATYTATASTKGNNLVLTATANTSGAKVVATTGLWAIWPVEMYYNAYNLPVLPWNSNIN